MKKEAVNFKECGKMYMGGFKGRECKGEMI